MTLEEAKSLMTQDALNKLKELISDKPTINTSNKANNDILMNALCRAVNENIINIDSLDDKIVKLLNAKTNTLSPSKLGYVISTIKQNQPNIVCCISLVRPPDIIINEWTYNDKDVNFTSMLDYILKYFKLNPNVIRTKLGEMLKPTIVNNIAQTVAKYQNSDDADRADINVSITTLTRLANMYEHMLFAEFKLV
jgi:hypothetical protein